MELKEAQRWMVWDTGCAKDCSVDMAFVFPTEDKALAIASLLNNAQCVKGDGQQLFQVFKVSDHNYMNS